MSNRSPIAVRTAVMSAAAVGTTLVLAGPAWAHTGHGAAAGHAHSWTLPALLAVVVLVAGLVAAVVGGLRAVRARAERPRSADDGLDLREDLGGQLR